MLRYTHASRSSFLTSGSSAEVGPGGMRASLRSGDPAAQGALKALMARGFHKPGMSKIGSDTTWAKLRARAPTRFSTPGR